MRENWESFPDAHIRVVNRFVSGDWLADEGEWTATNTGPVKLGPDQTIRATGKAARSWFVAVAEKSGDKISTLRIYYDLLSVQSQLGLTEQPGSE